MQWLPRWHLPVNTGDTRDSGLIPGWERSPGGGNGSPLQYSCLENPMDREAWQATVHGVTKSQTWLSAWIYTLWCRKENWRISRVWKCSNEKKIILLSTLYILWKHALWKMQKIRKTKSIWWLWETSFYPTAYFQLCKAVEAASRHWTLYWRLFTPFLWKAQRWVRLLLQTLMGKDRLLAHQQCLPGRVSKQA